MTAIAIMIDPNVLDAGTQEQLIVPSEAGSGGLNNWHSGFVVK
eukprot:CAMPEP_0204837460 /NCGR_PEP_ID=MMETSP1346-20131115/27977_1 /ASSEMBLY_ACC=CAM_ASM_000771 /TAXON_ID=215587 /ORGANISM="Aplanochytrium stocchinoi, Strain GSBS06" /LENGTH=42 /DNA_ID= /DNA_START= /DNA_END= /DNA_ORIENTATION=